MRVLIKSIVIFGLLALVLLRLCWRLLIDALAERWLESPAYCDPLTPKPWYVISYERYWARRRT